MCGKNHNFNQRCRINYIFKAGILFPTGDISQVVTTVVILRAVLLFVSQEGDASIHFENLWLV